MLNLKQSFFHVTSNSWMFDLVVPDVSSIHGIQDVSTFNCHILLTFIIPVVFITLCSEEASILKKIKHSFTFPHPQNWDEEDIFRDQWKLCFLTNTKHKNIIFLEQMAWQTSKCQGRQNPMILRDLSRGLPLHCEKLPRFNMAIPTPWKILLLLLSPSQNNCRFRFLRKKL